MQMQNAKVKILRKKYPKFIYQNYSFRISKGNLEIFFNFKIEPDIFFKPKIIIKNVKKSQLNGIGDRVLNNLIFHLGLMEIPSYWKATCSPEIVINPGFLNSQQIKWWKNLTINGMGQFFYENKIDFTRPNFLKIVSSCSKQNCSRTFLNQSNRGVLVPVGGGKDSAVTLELLKRASEETEAIRDIKCFALNPTEAAKRIMKVAHCKNPIIVERKIDKKLLELNQKGFLNGHTPFSAYLSFLNILVAVIFGQKYIPLSNERSANEGNLKYLGKTINHQYSKSFDFEKKFRDYSKKYLTRGIEYFSFLRPLYEIQIAKLFSKYPKYFSVFLSCNVASQTASGIKKPNKKWCDNCPKCLFVFATLYPFIKKQKLVKIFGENLFEKKELLPIMQELIGLKKFKPFECVGTKKESLVAFYLSWKKTGEQFSAKMPFLLKYFQKQILPKYPSPEKESRQMMNSWNIKHNLPKEFEEILKNTIS